MTLSARDLILARRSHTCPPPLFRCPKLGKISACLQERYLVRCAPELLCVMVILSVIVPSAHRTNFMPTPRSESQHATAWAGILLARHRLLTKITVSAHPTLLPV